MKTKSLFVGIDPGLTGAVALINSQGNILSIQPTPTLKVKKGKGTRNVYVESSMVTILDACRNAGTITMVGIENVHALPGQSITSMFNMGVGVGIWWGIIASLRLPVTRITAQAWKKALGIPTGSEKSESAVRALQLFPRANLMKSDRARVESDGMADALLIAEYVRRLGMGMPKP
jgi:crossover junction endodeoxyribonuclease RuvC